MHTLSAFQLLPEHIVRLIVDHVACSSRLHYDNIYKGSEEYKLLQMPLLWVCHNFRAFVYARFCSKCELQLEESGDRYVDSRRLWPSCLSKLDFPTHHLATDLYLNLSFWSIYSGKALRRLSGAPYEGCAFPLVRQLEIRLTLGDEYSNALSCYPSGSFDRYPPDTTANIAAFIQRVKQVAPDIRKVEAWSYSDAEELVKRRDIHTVDLIQQLYNIVETKTAITGYCRLLVEYLEPICNLVHVAYRIYATSSRIMTLIRRSAQTLQSLELSGTIRVDYTELIRNSDGGGGWMEYPCLHTLRLFSEYETALSRSSISNGAAPFPQLRRLAMRRAYPFGDDVLFRGNAATLEHLKIELDPKMVAMLKQLNVFTPTSHPKLKCVKANLCSSDARHVFAAAAEYLQFALSIAPRASVLTIPYLSSFGGTLTTELEMLGSHDNLQVLALYSATLSFWDIVNLIKSLPLLTDLETGDPTIDELPPQGVTLAQPPEYARSTYAPMGRRFRCWHITFSPSTRLGNLATCVLVLALICPNFDYAAVDGRHRERFMQEMKKQIAEPWFIQYAPHLRRLLFDGWHR
ncbi:hypothetical protein GGF42_000219 [Coemansia sp. RSA 2424]|nr:hypothetical protein GGF42_000219 [Coemansia sp. RSA 2424]